MKATELMRPEIAGLEPYAPIYPFEVLAERLGRSPESIVKLDANENPYGISPKVRAALAGLKYAHIYPDPESRALRARLSAHTGVPEELLLAGAGADELLDLVTRLFLGPGDAAVTCPPTFGMYAFDAAAAGARVVAVPRSTGFSLDVPGIEEAVRREGPKLIFVTSPNNPDGSWLSDSALERLLALPVVVLLDEAYVEFARPERSRIGWVQGRENLIVLRTFSKWASLAGLRVGYGAFPRALVPHLRKIKQPYNVSVAASEAAIAALDDAEWLSDRVSRIIAERERLFLALSQVPFLRPYPSRANFVLCRAVGRSARELQRGLERIGILVRYYSTAGLQDHVRISVGRPDDTDALLAALEELA